MSLRIEVVGVTLLVPDSNRIVYPDGRAPRIAATDGSIIPSHQAFVAFAQGAYEADAAPPFSFRADVDGAGEMTQWDAWLLDGHAIVVENAGAVPDGGVDIDDDGVFQPRWLVPGLQLAAGIDQPFPLGASAWLDVSQATHVRGTADPRVGRLPIMINEEQLDVTSRFTAVYEHADRGAQVRIAKGDDSLVVRFTDAVSQVVLTGNVPLEELVGGSGITHPSAGSPLTHSELLYALYEMPADVQIQVPYMAGGGHDHHAMSAGAFCGPDGSAGRNS